MAAREHLYCIGVSLLAVASVACAGSNVTPRTDADPIGPDVGPPPPLDTGPPPPPDTGPPPGPEACDRYDNNGNGQVDEGCQCTTGTTQTCYPGLAGTDIGACTPGVQACDTPSGEFMLWGACTGSTGPSSEVCGDGLDQDCSGEDLVCPECTSGMTRTCYSGTAGTSGRGICHGGTQTCGAGSTWGACTGEVVPGTEVCGNAIDEDCNGSDATCPECTPGMTRPCYGGPVGTAGVGACRNGTEYCSAASEWGLCTGEVGPEEEVCGNGIDEDCDGDAAPCLRRVAFVGECLFVACPFDAPYPVGCDVIFSGGFDETSCVAHSPGSSLVFFKAGQSCSLGGFIGELLCSSEPGPPLGPSNCPMTTLAAQFYVPSPLYCPN